MVKDVSKFHKCHLGVGVCLCVCVRAKFHTGFCVLGVGNSKVRYRLGGEGIVHNN